SAFKHCLSCYRPVNLHIWHFSLFRQAVRDHSHVWILRFIGSCCPLFFLLLWEKVEHPIVNALKRGPQFVDPVPEIICNGPSQFMSKVFELSQIRLALGLHLFGQRAEPLIDRNAPVVVLIEHYGRCWHLACLLECSH